jgi:hypothetical protein
MKMSNDDDFFFELAMQTVMKIYGKYRKRLVKENPEIEKMAKRLSGRYGKHERIYNAYQILKAIRDSKQ